MPRFFFLFRDILFYPHQVGAGFTQPLFPPTTARFSHFFKFKLKSSEAVYVNLISIKRSPSSLRYRYRLPLFLLPLLGWKAASSTHVLRVLTGGLTPIAFPLQRASPPSPGHHAFLFPCAILGPLQAFSDPCNLFFF